MTRFIIPKNKECNLFVQSGQTINRLQSLTPFNYENSSATLSIYLPVLFPAYICTFVLLSLLTLWYS